MKKPIRWLLLLGLCLALTVCGALAAEGDITVQLDGEALTFTDAVPQLRNQRTYLPFRAVFEAMGAEVDYKSNVVTATRDGKTLTMTIGSTQATLEENGVTLPIQMDVAPYLDAATWRTYVPVRFAAQAFDCVVGWDQKTLTAIIIDAEKLVDAAKEGKSYTYLEKLAAMNEKYNSGLWDLSATLDTDVSAAFVPLVSLESGVSGMMADNAKLDMTMHLKLDMDGLLGMASVLGGDTVTAEDRAVLDTLKTNGVDVAVRGDLDAGKLYMEMDLGALGAKAGVEPGSWYELDMAALTAQSGLAWDDFMAASGNSDTLDTLVAALVSAEPTDSTTAYADFKSAVDALCAAFSDEGFAEKDGAYVAEYATADNSTALALTLTMDGGQPAAYAMDIAANSTVDGSPVNAVMNVTMTADGKMNAGLDMDVGGMVTVTLVMDGAFTPGTTAPVTAPPAGAKILPFEELTKQQGVIGGGDGPTVLVGSPA